MRLVLGSGSATRRQLLQDAGMDFDVVPSEVDEDAVKADWIGTPADLAGVLAEMKALEVSERVPDALVIGADQVLELEGWIFNKPGDRTKAARHLNRLAGRTHELHTAMVVARGGAVQFAHRASPKLTMAPLSEIEIANYVAAAPDSAWATVGGYQVEGPGIRLFEKIEGAWHDILGLPLLPLLNWLRREQAA
ncbi:MAG: Maf family protein [Minwuia sp.]|uniref:Maf family protein n=1 Tax=Minwuia sp. TaxID=2493630 RepID=UPI003A8A144A